MLSTDHPPISEEDNAIFADLMYWAKTHFSTYIPHTKQLQFHEASDSQPPTPASTFFILSSKMYE